MTDSRQRGQWMLQAQKGNKIAYKALIDDISGPISGFVNKKIGFTGNTDDVVQESLLAIHKSRHSYDPSRSFDSWMFAIVRFKVVDSLRQFSKTGLTVAIDDSFQLADDTTVPDHQPPHDERVSILKNALASLPDKFRLPIELVKLKGKKVKEAAQLLGLSESNVKVRCSRGYKILLKKIERQL